MSVDSVAAFQEFVAQVEAQSGYSRPAAFAVGLATQALQDLQAADPGAQGGAVLDTWCPCPNLLENYGTAAILAKVPPSKARRRPGSVRSRAEATVGRVFGP